MKFVTITDQGAIRSSELELEPRKNISCGRGQDLPGSTKVLPPGSSFRVRGSCTVSDAVLMWWGWRRERQDRGLN